MNISLKNISEKNIFIRYLILIFTQFLAAINYNLFLNPFKIVSGGTNGISIITEQMFGWSPSIFILLFSVAIFIISLFALGIEKTSSALVATFVYPIFVEITAGLSSLSDLATADRILVSLIAGIISGAVGGIVCKIGLSQGGVSQISQVIEEKFKVSVTKVNFTLNMIVVLFGAYLFGIANMMYALIMLYTMSLVMDKVLLGISSNKCLYIITSCEEEVKDYIVKELGHGVTIFNVKGGFKDRREKIIMTVIPTNEYFRAVEIIREFDEKAFLVVTDSYEVKGGA